MEKKIIIEPKKYLSAVERLIVKRDKIIADLKAKAKPETDLTVTIQAIHEMFDMEIEAKQAAGPGSNYTKPKKKRKKHKR